jgi:hypothetical protein
MHSMRLWPLGKNALVLLFAFLVLSVHIQM